MTNWSILYTAVLLAGPTTGWSVSRFIHPADPRILQARSRNGDTVELHGVKDGAGGVSMLTSLTVTMENGDQSLCRMEANRIVEIILPEQAVIRVTWITSQSGSWTLRHLDGTVEGPTAFQI